MSTEWKPGDVAVVWINDRREVAIVRQRVQSATQGLEFAYVKGGFDMVDDLAPGWDARPLVVIDPEDRDVVDALCKALVEAMYAAGDERSAANGVYPATVAAALRQFANPTTPKPEEPLGLGAVVELAGGEIVVRTEGNLDTANWADKYGDFHWWADIAAVRVLSPGYTEGEAS